jgi:hypothetical protein
MKVTESEIEKVLQLLTETPGRITVAANRLSDDDLHWKPDKDSWSANDILAHLRACADVWSETIAAMLQKDEPILEDISPRDKLKEAGYGERSFQELFLSFVDQRRELLRALYDLELADWSRGALIKERRHTVFSQARRMALHEVTHNEQLEGLANTGIDD